MTDVKLEVRGIPQVTSALRKVGVDVKPQIKSRFLGIASLIVGVVQGRIPTRSGRSAASVKARASARGAAIAFGGQAAPGLPWLDFGGRRPNDRVTRERIEPDRYVYASISDERDATRDAVDRALESAIRQAGFDSRGHV